MTVVLLLAGGSAEKGVLDALDGSGMSVRRCLDAVDLLARIQAEGGDVVVVDGPRDDLDADLARDLDRHRMGGIALTGSPAGQAWAAALGFAEVLDPGRLADLPERIGRLVARDRASAGDPAIPAEPGRLLAVWGPAGAPGRSTVAVNLAAELARDETERVLLIDADTYGASIAQQLGLLDDVSGLLAAARAAHHGRSADPASSLAEHVAGVAPGFDVLTGLPRAELWRHVRPRAWQQVLDAALAVYTTVVVDLGFCLERPEVETRGHHRHHLALDALARARSVLAVASAEPVGLSRLVRGLDDLAELGLDPDLHLVLNRHDPSTGWRRREVEDTVFALTGLRAQAILPFDPPAALGALAAARTVREHDGQAPLARALAALAVELRRSSRVPAG